MVEEQGHQEIPFDCSDYGSNGLSLSFLDSGGDRPPLHFSHANGFPVSMYLPLMNRLAGDFRVMGLSLRGQDGLSGGVLDWHRPAADLAGFLQEMNPGPVIGVGHSIGAITTMFCAARHPQLFSGIILLDPVLFPRRTILTLRALRLLGRKSRLPLALRARRRRNGWADRQEALDYFRGKDLFLGWEEEFLRAYVTYGLKPDTDTRMVLVCPPEAEAQGFESYPHDVWSWMKMIHVPTLIVRGADSDVLSQECYENFLHHCPSARGIVVPGTGHLIPMQASTETIRIIKDFSKP